MVKTTVADILVNTAADIILDITTMVLRTMPQPAIWLILNSEDKPYRRLWHSSENHSCNIQNYIRRRIDQNIRHRSFDHSFGSTVDNRSYTVKERIQHRKADT